jgi:trans-aconitate methyltransferase
MSIQWNAEDYAKHSEGQHRWALSNVERLALSGHEAVVDLGCGDGMVTADIARRVPAGMVLGLDKSSEMIELARRTYAPELRNIAFSVADAQVLELPPEYDLGFSNSTLHWVADHPAVLRGLFQALKPGGRIFLSMSGRGTASIVFEAIAELAELPAWRDSLKSSSCPWYFFGPEEYEAWLTAIGFLSLRIELVLRPMRQTDLSSLEGWLRTAWMPYTNRVPDENRVRFVRDLARRIADRCVTAEDGALLLPMVNLEVEAEKPDGPRAKSRNVASGNAAVKYLPLQEPPGIFGVPARDGRVVRSRSIATLATARPTSSHAEGELLGARRPFWLAVARGGGALVLARTGGILRTSSGESP